MKIIIVGCGKVGKTLAEQLQQENTDITLIDLSESRLAALSDDIDALTIVGNGASIGTLMEADIENTDILIAVTNSDELNLLCCLIAQKSSPKCKTVARVRDPIYHKELPFIKEKLGVTTSINPEFRAAQEISRILRLPLALKVDTFAREKAELIKFKVLPEFGMDGMTIADISQKYRCDILFCGVESKDNVVIPGGSHVIHDGDLVSIMGTQKNASAFFKKIGLKTTQVKNAILVGGGTICYYLASALIDARIGVKIIEKDPKRCEELSELLPEAIIINGDGTSRDLLVAEGIAQAEGLVALTNMDEENILLSLLSGRLSSAKRITKVNRMGFRDVIDTLDIGSVVYPKYLTADIIIRYVRATQNSIGSNVETMYHIFDNRAEALEFRIKEDCPVAGIPIEQLSLKKNLLVACISHGGEVRIPKGQDVIQVGDSVIIVTTHQGLRDISDILDK